MLHLTDFLYRQRISSPKQKQKSSCYNEYVEELIELAAKH